MKKVLIVDDQPAIRELVGFTLEMGAYQILEAANGDEALQLAQTELPDLMLLDIQMPGGKLDGLQVCRILKSDEATRNIFIFLLTAKGQDADKQVGREAGADGYIVKPFNPVDLMDTVESVFK